VKFSLITEDNYASVTKIYLAGIATGNATFETKVPSFEEWDKNHLPFGRIIAEVNQEITGWAAFSKVSDRKAYSGVAEVSIYLAPEFRGQGIGTEILNELIAISESNQIWSLYCGIMSENKASIALHKKCGFREVGYREKIAQLHGVWRDNVIMERRSKIVGL
jgi:L-amino acid N-acyltransferase YncA